MQVTTTRLSIMPVLPAKPCTHPGCPALTHDRLCSRHTSLSRRQFDKQRGNSADRGYDRRWRISRKNYLVDHPWCECPLHAGKADSPLATVVDHRIPHRGDKSLFWDKSNWQAMGKECHDRKTATEDGDGGRRVGREGRGSVDPAR